MPLRSIWFSDDNDQYLQTNKGTAKLNALVNAIITHARAADSDGAYLRMIIQSYNLAKSENKN